MVSTHRSTEEGASSPGVLEGASPYPRVVPGTEIADAIRDAGRSAWQLGPAPSGVAVLVPILRLDVNGPGSLSWPSATPNPTAVLNERLALFLETQHEVAFGQLTEQDRTQWRRLWAAALHDIHGLSIFDVFEAAELHDKAHARKDIGEGRRLWKRLGYAWPWHFFDDPKGTPPAGWHSSGGPPALDATFEVWRSGRLSLMRFVDRAAARAA